MMADMFDGPLDPDDALRADIRRDLIGGQEISFTFYSAAEQQAEALCALVGLGSSFSGVVLERFITPESAAGLVKSIDQLGMEEHVDDVKTGVGTTKERLGTDLFQFKDDLATYFARASQQWDVFSNKIFSASNPLRQVFDFVEGSLGRGIEIPRQEEGAFMPVIARSLSNANKHADWALLDYPDIEFSGRVKEQISWNLFLEAPENGGQLVMYDSDVRKPLATSSDVPSAEYTPKVGDLLFIKSTHIHEVLSAQGSSRRLALGGYLGITEGDTILAWA